MSSPIRYPSGSPTLYVPVHRRTPGSYTPSSSRTPSPSPSSSPALSPIPFPSSPTLALVPTPGASARGIYTPAELLHLSISPLAKLSAGNVDAIRALVPEVVQTRKQRKALVWHARHPDAPRSHGRTSSRGSHAHTSESEEDRATTWRRI